MLKFVLTALCCFVSSSVDLAKVCCFQDSDVEVEQVGNSSALLWVDGFFCSPFINFVKRFTDAAVDHVIDDVAGFPGWRIMFDILRDHKARLEDVKRKAMFGVDENEMLDALLWGHYLKCVARAAAAVDFQLLPSSFFESSFEKGSAGGLAMINRRPNPWSNVHIDPGEAVINIHLGRGFEDTSTAFFRSRSGEELCVGDGKAMRACKNLIDEHTAFNMIQDQRLSQQPIDGPCVDVAEECGVRASAGECSSETDIMYRDCRFSCGVCGGLWLGPHVPAERDHSGVFVKYHETPYRFNRLVLYSGHLFHSSFISRDALIRIEDSYEACATRAAGEEFGIGFASKGGRMVVKRVRDGPIAQWNAANPGSQVQAGFFVLEVNGKRGSTAELKKAVKSSNRICMLISRRSPDDVSVGGRLTLQHFVHDPSLADSVRRYAEVDGLNEVPEKIEAGHVGVEVDRVTFRLLNDLVAAELLPGYMLQQVKVSQGEAKRSDDAEL